jgi:ectoine hydroxylase-related dioxygenase (phytanoyl-CoA dioxygenase family)
MLDSPTQSRLVLTQQQVDDYAAKGYFSYGKILPDHYIDLLRDEYDREVQRAGLKGRVENVAAKEEGTASEEMLEVSEIATENLLFRKLASFDRILDIVEDLIGPNIRLLEATLLYKPPSKGSFLCWHQDNVYQLCTPASMVTGWLTLDEVGPENGAMRMIPGSHLRPDWRRYVVEDGAKYDAFDSELIELPAGGISFHHCQVQHCSLPNTSDKPRRAIVFLFIPIGTQSPRLLTGDWGFFTHPILRMKA